MLLEDITNAILEIVRAGSIVDDERIDYRLIEQFVKAKRATYIQGLIDGGKAVPEQMAQYVTIELTPSTLEPLSIVQSSDTAVVPKFLSTKFGPAIQEVTSVYMEQFPFRVVNNNYFRVVGSGKFNTKFVFVTYRDGKLLFKSKNVTFLQLTSIRVKAILEDPDESPTFDQDVNQYPIDMQCFDYIKDEVVKNDIRLLMGGITDEVNDASGEIK